MSKEIFGRCNTNDIVPRQLLLRMSIALLLTICMHSTNLAEILSTRELKFVRDDKTFDLGVLRARSKP
jgi:hypothetical protein